MSHITYGGWPTPIHAQDIPNTSALAPVKQAILALNSFFECFVESANATRKGEPGRGSDGTGETPSTEAAALGDRHLDQIHNLLNGEPLIALLADDTSSQLSVRLSLVRFLVGLSSTPPEESALLWSRRELLDSLTTLFRSQDKDTSGPSPSRIGSVPSVVSALLSLLFDSTFLHIFREVVAMALVDGSVVATSSVDHPVLSRASSVFRLVTADDSSEPGNDDKHPRQHRRVQSGADSLDTAGDLFILSTSSVSSVELGRCLRAVKHLLLRGKALIQASLSRRLQRRLALLTPSERKARQSLPPTEESEFLALITPTLQCLRHSFNMREALLRSSTSELYDTVAQSKAFLEKVQNGDLSDGLGSVYNAVMVEVNARCLELLERETEVMGAVLDCRTAEEEVVNSLRRSRLDWSQGEPTCGTAIVELQQRTAAVSAWRLRTLPFHLLVSIVPYVSEWRLLATAHEEYREAYEVASFALEAWSSLDAAAEAVDAAFVDTTHRELRVTIDEAHELIRYYLQRDWLSAVDALVRSIELPSWGTVVYHQRRQSSPGKDTEGKEEGSGVLVQEMTGEANAEAGGCDEAVKQIMQLKEYSSTTADIGRSLTAAFQWLERIEYLLVVWAHKDEDDLVALFEEVAEQVTDTGFVFPFPGVGTLMHTATVLFLRHCRFSQYVTDQIACLGPMLAGLWYLELPFPDRGREPEDGPLLPSQIELRVVGAQEMLGALQQLMPPAVVRDSVPGRPHRFTFAVPSKAWTSSSRARNVKQLQRLQRRLALLHANDPKPARKDNEPTPAWIDIVECSQHCREAVAAGNWKALSQAVDELAVSIAKAPPLWITLPPFPAKDHEEPQSSTPFDLRLWASGEAALYRRLLWWVSQCHKQHMPIASAVRLSVFAKSLTASESLQQLIATEIPPAALIYGFLRPAFAIEELQEVQQFGYGLREAKVRALQKHL